MTLGLMVVAGHMELFKALVWLSLFVIFVASWLALFVLHNVRNEIGLNIKVFEQLEHLKVTVSHCDPKESDQ
jgi:hypothetical protein